MTTTLTNNDRDQIFKDVSVEEQVISFLLCSNADKKEAFFKNPYWKTHKEALVPIIKAHMDTFLSLPEAFRDDLTLIHAYVDTMLQEYDEPPTDGRGMSIKEDVYRKYPELITKILSKQGKYIKTMPPEILANRNYVKMAVQSEGLAIACTEFKGDKEIALLAVKNDCYAYNLTGIDKNDVDLIFALLKSDQNVEFKRRFGWLPKGLFKHTDIMVKMALEMPRVFISSMKWKDEWYENNPDILLTLKNKHFSSKIDFDKMFKNLELFSNLTTDVNHSAINKEDELFKFILMNTPLSTLKGCLNMDRKELAKKHMFAHSDEIDAIKEIVQKREILTIDKAKSSVSKKVRKSSI